MSIPRLFVLKNVNMKKLSANFVLRRDVNGDYTVYDKSCNMRYSVTPKLYKFLRLFKYHPIDYTEIIDFLSKKGIETSDLTKALSEEQFRYIFIEDNQEANLRVEDRDIYSLPKIGEHTQYSPERIDLLLTRKCNLVCRHCFEVSSPNETVKDIDIQRLCSLAQEMEDIDVKTLKITGGEVLMFPLITEFLSALKTKRFETILLTNAIMLNDELCEIIAEGGIKLGISLDGISPVSHNFLRGKGAFEAVQPKLSLVKDFGIKFSITTSVHSRNISETEKIVDYAINTLGARTVFINKLKPLGRALYNKDIFISEEENDMLEERVKSLSLLYGSEKIILSDDSATMRNDISCKTIPLNTPLVCAAGNTILSIDDNLDVYPCVYGHGKSGYNMGNLYKENLLDIWRSPKWEKFRGKTTLGDIPKCRVCKNNTQCGLKNCRMKAVYEGRSFYSNVSYCKEIGV